MAAIRRAESSETTLVKCTQAAKGLQNTLRLSVTSSNSTNDGSYVGIKDERLIGSSESWYISIGTQIPRLFRLAAHVYTFD